MTRIFFTHLGKQRKADNFGNYINKAAIFAFTENGIRLASKISCELHSCYNGNYKSNYKSNRSNNYEKHYESGCKSSYAGGFEFFNYNNINYRENIEYAFNEYDFLIFFISLGAAIRLISPFIKSKLSDPGVIVIDEKGNFAISALSGHIGGANELTAGIAEIIGATPVITTATDISNKFSLDLFAKKFNLNIENKNFIKYINKSSLNNEKLIIFIPESDYILSKNEEFKNEIKKYFAGFNSEIQLVYAENGIKEILKKNINKLNIIVISYRTDAPELSDFALDELLYAGLHDVNICRLFPRNLTVGIGCNKNTSFEEIENFIEETFNENNLSILSIKNVATIDIKSEEKGILEFAKKYAKYIDFFSKDEINNFISDKNLNTNPDYALNTNMITESACFRYTGAYSVCEPCALLSSNTNKELLICKKKKGNTTIAAAI
ncbi:MAG: cobalt-precorrin 5A hydrolase [bacterium]